ncbi:hypothetical protein D1867_07305 [Acidianus infernus]|uniref:Uncharacterized protein n=1 Tax=Acidianus infernus TaxID=12915 RepID=A0A6A9QIQ2_ACIIN|nr:hypothetical protein [Acidianus infernus]MUM65046.1 hypothetical protein [Acidianus infernus]
MEEWGFSISGLYISTNFQPLSFPNTIFQILVDEEFGNLIVEFKRDVKKSFEGEAFVTIGVDENGRISYISIEPLDKDLKEGVKGIKNE